MTTIAYRDRTLAADTRGTWGSTPFSTSKIVDLGEVLVAGAGEIWRVHGVVDGVRACLDMPTRPPTGVFDFVMRTFRDPDYNPAANNPSALLVDRSTGRVCVLMGPRFEFVGHSADAPAFLAIGSGGDYAMGAMGAGASAADAVRIASTLDVYTSADVEIVALRAERGRHA